MPDIYDVDLSSGFLTRVLDTGEVIQTTIDELSGGRLSLAGRSIRNNETGRFEGSLSASGLNQIESLGQGQLLMLRPKTLDELNSTISANGMDAVSFSFELELPDGRLFSETVDGVSITPIEGLIIVRSGDKGQLEYDRLVPVIDDLTGQITNMPPGSRLATPDEATRRGITGYLMSAMRDQMDIIAAARISDGEGGFLESAYEVAQFIARAGIFNIAGLQLRQL